MDDIKKGDVNENGKVLSDYHVPDIVSSDFNKSIMAFSSNNGLVFNLEIPENLLKDDVVIGVRSYINSHFYQRKGSESGTRRQFKSIEIFIKCASEQGQVNTSIGFDVLNNLKKKTDSEMIIFHCMNAITSILNHCINEKIINAGIITNDTAIKIRNISANVPRIKRPQSDKTPSLEKEYKLEFNNTEIQKAFRVWCSRFLIEWSYIRYRFKEMMPNQHQIIIDRIKYQHDHPLVLNVTNSSISWSNMEPSRDRDALAEMNRIYFDFAIESENPFLVDDLFNTFYTYRKRKQKSIKISILPNIYADTTLSRFRGDINTRTLISELKKWWRDDEFTKILEKPIRLNFTRMPSAASLVAPSHEEAIVMSWLLASDDQQRQQRQNIINAKLSDLEEFCYRKIPVIKPNFFKVRSQRTTGAAINKESKNDVYSALALMKKGLVEGYKLGLYDEERVINASDKHIVPCLKGRSVNYFKTKIYTFGMENSISRKYMNEICKETGVNVDPVNGIIREALIHRKTQLDTIISLNVIAETSLCAYKLSTIDDLPHVSGDLKINKNTVNLHEMEVNALVRNHTLKTQIETYFFRSEDRVKLDSGHKFAKLVGDEMVKLAIGLANNKELNTRVMSIKDVEVLLGVKSDNSEVQSEINDIYEAASLQKYAVDKTGIIEREGQVIVVKSPFVAHLISCFIDHIDSSLNDILLSNYEYALKLIVHRMFLKSIILDHFDKKMIQRGSSIYGKYDFPFPNYEGF